MNVVDHTYGGTVGIHTPRKLGDQSVMVRPRVVELLNATTEKALCIVRAPYKCGKSAAIRRWTLDTGKNLRWLHLVKHVATADEFWLQLFVAVSSHLFRSALHPVDSDFALSSISRLTALFKHATPVHLDH